MKIASLLVFLFFITSSCTTTNDPRVDDRQELAALFIEIEEFISQYNCSPLIGCETMAVGSKACGGPSLYIVYPQNVDKEKLQELVANYTTAQRRYNQEHNIISDCSTVIPPQTIGCETGKCVIQM